MCGFGADEIDYKKSDAEVELPPLDCKSDDEAASEEKDNGVGIGKGCGLDIYDAKGWKKDKGDESCGREGDGFADPEGGHAGGDTSCFEGEVGEFWRRSEVEGQENKGRAEDHSDALSSGHGEVLSVVGHGLILQGERGGGKRGRCRRERVDFFSLGWGSRRGLFLT